VWCPAGDASAAAALSACKCGAKTKCAEKHRAASLLTRVKRIGQDVHCAARAFAWECGVEHIEIASDARQRAFAEADEPVQGTGAQYSPGDFLKQAGLVVAVCLGLAMLARVLVMVIGEY
jgi:hypothetical protein